MIGTVVGLVVVLALVLLFAWLTRRGWGTRRKFVKWPGVILSGLLTLVCALIFIVALIGAIKLYAPASNPVVNVKVAGTPQQIKRGEKIVVLCTGCHSTVEKPPLDGSKDNFLAGGGAPPVGTVYGPNLTPAGEVNAWSDGEIIRAIREGVHQSGRPLVIMPSEDMHNLGDADVRSIVAYLRSQPAVKNQPQTDTPSNSLNLLGAIFVGAGLFNPSTQPPITQAVAVPPEGPTADYGKYLVSNLGCKTCHGADLAGGTPGGFAPAGPNLTVLVPKWSEADFTKTIRTGIDPSGHALDAEAMPWKEYTAFSNDDDLKAIFSYMHGLAPVVKPAK